MTPKKRASLLSIACCIALLVVIAGCAEQENYSPEITGAVPGLHRSLPPAKIVVPAPPKQEPVYIPKTVPPGWTPPKYVEKKWKAIVIHHSATDRGSAEIFDRYHKNGRGWEGVGYDFVIGNGNGSGNGQVQPTFRWRQQKIGAHCKTDYTNWANRDAVGICLVGNFNVTFPGSVQMSSLAKLVRFLSNRYKIPKSRIYGHNTTPRHSIKTDCPGKKFSMKKLKSML
jgi:N-acetylmuramoyl-L-alanine amidase